jgi:DNA-binding response OmpR family regulator
MLHGDCHKSSIAAGWMIDLVETCIPDVAMLDVMMPKKIGYEVCTRMRERAD